MQHQQKFGEWGQKQALALVKALTRPGRLAHCLAVAGEAAHLARRFGYCEASAARIGLLHDLARDLDADSLRHLAGGLRSPQYPQEFNDRLILLHAPAAVRLIKERLYPLTAEEERAIVHHPCGDPQLCVPSLILQIADLTSRDRRFAEAERLRNAIEHVDSLEEAALLVWTRKIAWLQSAGGSLLPVTLQTMEALRKRCR